MQSYCNSCFHEYDKGRKRENQVKPLKAYLADNLNTSVKGAIGELYVSIIAMLKGSQVLRNLSPTGKTDLCLVVDDCVVQIDVKVATWQRSSQCWSSMGTNVRLPRYAVIVVTASPYPSDWSIKWHSDKYGDPKCPPGLENFWD